MTIGVAGDPNTLATKINAFVTAYNTVITTVHKLAGYGTTKASDPTIAGDSAMRRVTDSLRSTLGKVFGSGQFDVLATIGLKTGTDGTLALDSTKLSTAFNSDPAAVERLLGRAANASSGGAMATLGEIAASLTDPVNGVLTLRTNQFNDQAKTLDSRATREQSRLDAYQLILQKQFSAMETAYSQNQSLQAQLARIG